MEALYLTIELKETSSIDIFNCIQQNIIGWSNVLVTSGNVSFTGKEWAEFIKNGKYPERIERTKSYWDSNN